MKTTARTTTRSALVGAVVLAVASLTATSAGADTGEVEYECEFGVGDPEGEGSEGEGTTTASFDTAVPDGLVVDVGERVSFDPFTGSITLPDGFTDLLRTAGFTTISGGGEMFAYIDEAPDEFNAFFGFEETPVPAEGSVSVDVEGDVGRFRPEDAGTYTIVGGGFYLYLDTAEEDPGAGMFCEPVDGDVVIDTFEAVGAATPTTTVTTTSTATATAVRPVVVQTDFAEDDATALPLLGVGALVTLAAGAVGLARGRVRTASRRH